MIDQNGGMESGEGFISYGYGRLEDFAAPIQLAKVMDHFARWILNIIITILYVCTYVYTHSVLIKCNFLNFLKLTSVILILGKSITSLCWRPDGKAIAIGLEDGTVSLHDVEVSSICTG